MQKFIEPQMVKIIHQKPEKIITIEMVHLPKGKFKMGEGSEQREVVIDYEFEMGKYPVTFDEYDIFCEDTKRKKPKDEDWGRGKRPVINVSWDDAEAFCKWLSEKSNQNYRLPTETEWEYACRAGTTSKWSFGDDKRKLNKYAWYDKNSNGTTHVVGEKLANPWGLFDMHGNISEWCQNDHKDNYPNTKTIRGGSSNFEAIKTNSTFHGGSYPDRNYNNVGFRLLRTLP